MKFRKRFYIALGLVILSILLFITREQWQSGFFNLIQLRQTKLEIIKLIIDILNGVLGIVPGIYVLIKLFFPEVQPEFSESVLTPTTPDELLNKYVSIDWNQTTWINRQIVNTRDLRTNPFLVLSGPMKSGKSREAVELVRRSLQDGLCNSTHTFDITSSVRSVEPDYLLSQLNKKLDNASRTLFFFNEFPKDPTDKQLENIGKYLKALNKCSPGYFVSTIRSEYLVLNPKLRNWLENNHIQLFEMKLLEEDQASLLLDELLQHKGISLDSEIKQILIDNSNGTPYHLILIVQHLSTEGNFTNLTVEDAKKISSTKLDDIWIEIRSELKKNKSETESLLEALAVFYHSDVPPVYPLVLAYSEQIERKKRKFNNSWLIRRNLNKAIQIVKNYDITYHKTFIFPEVAVESLSTSEKALNQIENFLLSYHRLYRLIHISRWDKNKGIWLRAMHQLSATYYFQENFSKAIEGNQAIVKVKPRDMIAWYNLGVLLDDQGRPDEAEQAYRQALDADPKKAEAWSNLGVLLNQQGRPDEAEQAYRQALDADPKDASTWYNLGVLLDDQGRLEEAEQAYRQALDADPKKAEAWSNLGVLLNQQGRLDEAEQAYRQALDADPKKAEAWYNLGVLLDDQGRLEEAEKAYHRAVDADPKKAEAWYNLGVLYFISNRLKDAQNALEQAVELEPEKANFHASLGAIYKKLNRNDEAKRELSEAQRLSINETIYNRACIAALCQEIDTAFNLLQEALAKKEVRVEWVCKDPDWEDLRDNPRFKKIIGEL